MAVASAGPYVTPPLSFFTGRMPFLPPKQQRQSAEGTGLTTEKLPCYDTRETLTLVDLLLTLARERDSVGRATTKAYRERKCADIIGTVLVPSAGHFQ